MLKELGTVVAATATGMVVLGGMASASPGDCGGACRTYDGIGQEGSVDREPRRQVGLVNVNNTSVAENVTILGTLCDNRISAGGVQVSVEGIANSVNVPVASPGRNETSSHSPDFCAMSGIIDQEIE